MGSVLQGAFPPDTRRGISPENEAWLQSVQQPGSISVCSHISIKDQTNQYTRVFCSAVFVVV